MGIGTVNIDGLLRLETAIKELDRKGYDKFKEKLLKQLTARLLRKIVLRTPVGEEQGGTLRRGWTGGVDNDPFTYVAGMDVVRTTNRYTLNISNSVHYATYVENGHAQRVGRYVPAIDKRLVKPWVEGKFMVKTSVDEVKNNYPNILARELQDYLKGALNVR